ncbi:hypothetical protein [Pontibacter amylolyticus]|uniref:hypothetical protein n=1 Tax=Pontibacter amylolyticus TaxID=1424080 RepID=UPI00166AB2E3|nr:hypothetical protein [Pontibacter amylolyticus]
MEIIFQSGEFYGEENSWIGDLFITSIGAFLGFCGALILFRYQLSVEKEKNGKAEKDSIERKLHYFTSLIHKITGASKEQADHLRAFCNSFSEDPFELPRPALVSSLDIKRFSEGLSHEEYYYAYISKFGLTKSIVYGYRRLYSYIDFLNMALPQLDEVYKQSVIYHNELKSEYTDLVNESVHMARELVKQLVNDEEYKSLTEFLEERLHRNNENAASSSSLLLAQEEWVDAVSEFLKVNYIDDETLSDLIRKLDRVTNVFIFKEQANDTIKDMFKKSHTKIEEAHRGLLEVSSNLVSTYISYQ